MEKQEFLSFPNYLNITDDESEREIKITENEKKASRSRDKSLDNLRKYKSYRKDRYKHSKNNKYKRYDKSRSSSIDSSDNSDSFLKSRHRSRNSRKDNESVSLSEKCYKRSKMQRYSSSSSDSSIDSDSSSYSHRSLSSIPIYTKPNINKDNSSFKSKSNLFEDKKSKWSTIEDDEKKLNEKSNIIQVTNISNKNESNLKKEDQKAGTNTANIIINPDQKENIIKIQRYKPPVNSITPDKNWRLFTFKEKEKKDIYKIDTKAYYLIGKEENANDIVINHPSCSRLHAAIQYLKDEKDSKIKMNIMDLNSTNATFLNKKKLEPRRYYELKEYDVINFGNSTRDYIVMLEN